MQLPRASVESPNAILSGMRGLRGLGLACPAGYHAYTPDGVNYECQPDVGTVAADYSATIIAKEAAAQPWNPIGQFEAAYGGLTNAQQEQAINCQEYVGASLITGAPVPASCAGILATRAAAPIVGGLPVISTPSTEAGLPSTYKAPLVTKSTSPGTVYMAPSASTPPVQPAGTPQNNTAAWIAYTQAAQAYSAAQSTPPAANKSITSATARIENLTTGNNSQFNVGDRWRIAITGAPNSPVTSTASQNGVSSTSNYGSTDANGSFSLSGAMDAGAIGNWSEQWAVGGVNAGSITFSVVAAAGGHTQSSSDTSNPLTDTRQTGGNNALVPPIEAASCFKLFGDSESCIGPIGSMTGLAVGAGLLVLYMMTKGKR